MLVIVIPTYWPLFCLLLPCSVVSTTAGKIHAGTGILPCCRCHLPVSPYVRNVHGMTCWHAMINPSIVIILKNRGEKSVKMTKLQYLSLAFCPSKVRLFIFRHAQSSFNRIPVCARPRFWPEQGALSWPTNNSQDCSAERCMNIYTRFWKTENIGAIWRLKRTLHHVLRLSVFFCINIDHNN